MSAAKIIEHPLEPQFRPVTLMEVLRHRARQQPDAVGYTFLPNGEEKAVTLTYDELDRQARAIAAMLKTRGAAGQPVLLMFPTGLDYVAAFFGCLYAGSTAVGVYPPRPNRSLERFAVIARDSRVRVVLTIPALRSRVRPLGKEIGLGDLEWITTDRIDKSLSEEWQMPALDGDALALLQYTSGSTARPNGTMVSHANILHNSRIICEAFGHTKESVVVGWLPMTHDMGLIGNMLQPLYVGCPYIFMSPEDFLVRPVRWLQAISRYRATTSGAPNFAYDLCIHKIKPEQTEGLDLTSWDLAYNGAEPVRPQTMEQFATAFAACGFRREAFYPCYGLAEATLMVTGGSKAAPPVERVVSAEGLEQKRAVPANGTSEKARTIIGCGHVWLNQEVIIVDPDTCLPCAEGDIGEIWVAGPSVTQGYWNQSHQTGEVFEGRLEDSGEGPYLRTGDLGFLHEAELFITGRLKDLIIIGGANHFPVDIEMTVEACHAAIRPNCVAAIAVDVDGAERLAVVAEIHRHYLTGDKADGSAEEILAAVKRAVAEKHDLSTHAVCLIKQYSMPKTSSGKIQRHLCRKQYLAGELNIVNLSEE